MRVKTVPRQRMAQSNKIIERGTEVDGGKIEEPVENALNDGDKNPSENERDIEERIVEDLKTIPSMNEKKKKETLSYSDEALDMSIKHQVDAFEENSSFCHSIAGPSCCKYADVHVEEESKGFIRNDDNDNILILNPDVEHCCSIAGGSSKEDLKSSTSSSDDEKSLEAVNLCKKDCHEEDSSNPVGGCDERLKDTFLYKIMTDPTFLENIQKHKQSKRYTCQFCKQEFVNGDELADHLDVKKNESNQVMCCACKKTFAQKRYLRYHQRCHSERAKFTCDICTKKYTRMDNLSRHNAFHVNPDKFSCTYCEKTFARKDLLNKHLKCHDNKYRFFCETCQKYFKGPLTLDNHRKNFHSIA